MAEHMLSTEDNPWSPVTHFDEWQAWDLSHGYNTLALQARLTVTSDELSEADQMLAIEQAIDDVIEMHAGGLYIRVPIE